MAEKLSVQIALMGAKEVEQELASLGEVGVKAFEEITRAAQQAGGFDKLDTKDVEQRLASLGVTGEEAIKKITSAAMEAQKFDALVSATQAVEQGLDKLSEAGNKASESFSGLTLESTKTAVDIAKTTAEIAKLGVEIFAATQKTKTLTKILVEITGYATTTVRAVSLLVPAMGTLAVVTGGTALALAAAAAGLKVLETAATAAAKPYEQLNFQLQTLATTSGTSFEAVQRGRTAFAEIGVSADAFNTVLGKIQESLKNLDVGAALKKSAGEAEGVFNQLLEAEKTLLEVQIKAEQAGGARVTLADRDRLLKITELLKKETNELADAEAKVGEARAKFAEAAANDLNKVLEAVKAIQAGQKELNFDPLVKAETIIKSVGLSLKQTADKGGDAGEALLKFIANADKATAMNVGKAFGLSETDIDRVRRYGVEITKIPGLYDRIRQTGGTIGSGASREFEKMRDAAQRTESAWARLNAALSSTIFARIGASISAALNNAEAAIIEFAAAGVEGFNRFVNSALSAFSQLPGQIGAILSTIGTNIWTTLVQGGQQAVTAVSQFFSQLPTQIAGYFAGFGTSVWDGLVSGAKAAVDRIMAYFAELKKSILETLGLSGGAGAGAPQGPGFARGGPVGGRGSGTSDSNLAWVSRGEHIMPARAVRQPGVLALLEALRRSGGNLSGVLDRMGHFALGGMVSAPAFARGGTVGGMNHVTIAFPGLPEVGGLRASSAVVEELRRSAALAQVRSGGRKPSRYT